jgi:acetolactate synthase-1/2/3 large subunit
VSRTDEFGPALDQALGLKGIRLLHVKTDVEVISNQTTITALREKART